VLSWVVKNAWLSSYGDAGQMGVGGDSCLRFEEFLAGGGVKHETAGMSGCVALGECD